MRISRAPAAPGSQLRSQHQPPEADGSFSTRAYEALDPETRGTHSAAKKILLDLLREAEERDPTSLETAVALTDLADTIDAQGE